MQRQPRQKALPGIDKVAAERLAIQALAFLASEPQELGRFLALTGIEPSEIRATAQEQGFLAGVLEYLCAHEPLLLAFARDGGVAPSEVERALEALSGRRWSRDVP
jgi:hypothetical protein